MTLTPSHDYAEAAALLGVSEAWLREHTPTDPLPHIKFGGRCGRVRFTDEHLIEIRRRFEVGGSEPKQPRTDISRPSSRRRAS